MNLKEQSAENWEEIPYDKSLVEKAIQLADRDLRVAKDIFRNGEHDWSFSIAYNAMLQAGRALMFSEGYRPTGEYKHVSVIGFVKKKFGRDFADKILFMFNKIRKKRHTAVYEQADIISEGEARTALEAAEEFVKKVKELLE